MEEQVNIGGLDTLVTLRAVTIGRSKDGSKTYNFRDHGDVFAHIERRIDEQVNTGNPHHPLAGQDRRGFLRDHRH